MDTKIQKRILHKGRKKYATFYINLPAHIVKKASWLKKHKVVNVDVDVLGHVTIKPD